MRIKLNISRKIMTPSFASIVLKDCEARILLILNFRPSLRFEISGFIHFFTEVPSPEAFL